MEAADAHDEKHYMEYRRMSGDNPAVQGGPSDLEDFFERQEGRAIVARAWNMGTWITTTRGGAAPILGFGGVYIDRDIVIPTRA